MSIKFELLIKDNITSSLAKIQKKLDQLPQEAFNFYKDITPVKSGNARKKTTFNKAKEEIKASYPYAQRLDEGYSKQAPHGMSKPTEDFIAKRSRQIITGK